MSNKEAVSWRGRKGIWEVLEEGKKGGKNMNTVILYEILKKKTY